MYAELRNDVPFWGRVYKIVGICSLPPGSVATLRSSQDAPPLPLRRGDSPNSADHGCGPVSYGRNDILVLHVAVLWPTFTFMSK